MNPQFKKIIENELESIKEKGLFKEERILGSKQGRKIKVGAKSYLNFCSNNYLGLAGDKKLIQAGKRALEKWGFGLSSVRFICGTQEIHKELERKVARFMGYQDAILYGSCYDANLALFQAIATDQDAIISDQLNHASLIDGVRLTKAERFIYNHADMRDLEEKLKAAQKKRLRLIVTDGVFSMEGDIAPMKEICDLAEKYDALVVMDDSHATGFMGKTGRGTHEFSGVGQRVDFITSTFGKALGGASGGFIVSTKENIEFLRQRSRNYIFSNSLPPVIAGVNSFVIGQIIKNSAPRKQLWENTRYFRKKMQEAGFQISPQEHPIVPIMLGDAKIAKNMAAELFKEEIYVVAFAYPVVPEGKARIRVQISAEHTRKDLDKAVKAFVKTKKELISN
ncbi:MAG: glycine C-acetyltransferase [Candidatus Staskawiczbacteria bacterium RIFCSPHIGHO2_02_FULL_42_22]|uniref:2-amino-3-ketobutyrate coenzyme A ligase n=1 Tax=Candidatus Staskawiczbacteria bacterium RIFCSPHIGHO2_02_FULL_42_22 TaxID=1802207 RepID=A0A1G2I529_9BACT|nr:MAG: glycine C-acetyltransferase [Candidatus Staskawiczbacteria bacterium RIFCSPHIGHO2_02_FULL_42_22]